MISLFFSCITLENISQQGDTTSSKRGSLMKEVTLEIKIKSNLSLNYLLYVRII